MIVMVMKKYSIDAIEMDGVDFLIVEHQRPHRRIRQVEIERISFADVVSLL
jgi:hypothetical protein